MPAEELITGLRKYPPSETNGAAGGGEMKKSLCVLALLLIASVAFVLAMPVLQRHFSLPVWLCPLWPGRKVHVPQMIDNTDSNRNGRPDALDLVAGARGEVRRGTLYDGQYVAGGFPPEGTGVCTDVIWRAFREADTDLKAMIDRDIRDYPKAYGSTGLHPDPAIDFRRVRNLHIFFSRHAKTLTIEVLPADAKNLSQWQPGDIVIFGGRRHDHVGIISPARRRDGVPLMIHNSGPRASEGNALLSWPIVGHYRFVFSEQMNAEGRK